MKISYVNITNVPCWVTNCLVYISSSQVKIELVEGRNQNIIMGDKIFFLQVERNISE